MEKGRGMFETHRTTSYNKVAHLSFATQRVTINTYQCLQAYQVELTLLTPRLSRDAQ